MTRVVLTLDGLSRRFSGAGGRLVLRQVTLTVREGEIVALIGPSGSGKTTLLSIAGGLLAPSRGRVGVDGVALAHLDPAGRRAALRGRVGFVFQRFLLLPELTALENAALGGRLGGLPVAAAVRSARELLGRLGLGARLADFPETLSAGEQQRVAVARALAAGPALVLADEPTASLDWPTADRVLEALRGLVAVRRTGVLVATHDSRVAAAADRVLTLRDGALQPDARAA